MKECINCHNMFSDDANYCPKCGHSYKKKKRGGRWLLIIALVIGVIMIVNDRSGKSFNDGDGFLSNVTERDLTSSDYSITKKEGLTSYTYTITAIRDIKECTIEFELLSDNKKVVYSDTKTKKDLIKGASYTYKFSYGFFDALDGSYVSYRVTGKVSLV